MAGKKTSDGEIVTAEADSEGISIPIEEDKQLNVSSSNSLHKSKETRISQSTRWRKTDGVNRGDCDATRSDAIHRARQRGQEEQ